MKAFLSLFSSSSSTSGDEFVEDYNDNFDPSKCDFGSPTTSDTTVEESSSNCHTTAQQPNELRRYKILVVGDSGVGKSSIISSFKSGDFNESTSPTIGVEFLEKTINTVDGSFNLKVIDSAGQNMFRAIVKPFFRDIQGVVIVYDITDQKTFDHVRDWIKLTNDYAPDDVKIVLAGNKKDLEEDREVTFVDATDFATKNNVIVAETTAKQANTIDKLFTDLVERIFKRLN
ncbi:Ras-related protein Rab [Acrasis kona]|uniref:Ras-related protein Rab n=1 Tax=Acrasis kona TaxID=1008807 RepID=A0AAW2Z4A7_9EUKA